MPANRPGLPGSPEAARLMVRHVIETAIDRGRLPAPGTRVYLSAADSRKAAASALRWASLTLKGGVSRLNHTAALLTTAAAHQIYEHQPDYLVTRSGDVRRVVSPVNTPEIRPSGGRTVVIRYGTAV